MDDPHFRKRKTFVQNAAGLKTSDRQKPEENGMNDNEIPTQNSGILCRWESDLETPDEPAECCTRSREKHGAVHVHDPPSCNPHPAQKDICLGLPAVRHADCSVHER